MPYHQHTFHEADDFEIVAVIEFHIEPATGDGYNEPREPACAIIDAVSLERREIKGSFDHGYGSPCVYRKVSTPLGAAPDWVFDCLVSSEALQDEMMDQADDGPDPDDARDRRIDDELTGGAA